MEGLVKRVTRNPLANIDTKNVKRRGASIVKDSIHQFKRLSSCSWDEFDVSNFGDENDVMESQKFQLRHNNKIKMNLYPSDGQPCACVCSWEVTLTKKLPGKTRKCKIVHTNRAHEIRAFTGRITVFEDKIAIWGSIKDGHTAGEDFELTLTKPANGYYADGHLLEGFLMRGNRKQKANNINNELSEQTHDVIVYAS